MKPKYKVGDRVITMRGTWGVIDRVLVSVAYHLKGTNEYCIWQQDGEIRGRLRRNKTKLPKERD